MTHPLRYPALPARARQLLSRWHLGRADPPPTPGRSPDTALDPHTVREALDQVRRSGADATIRTRGGHLHPHVRVTALGRRHAVLHAPHTATVLLPLCFVESVTRHEPGDR
ncbi:hypothetical protein [Nocardia puris]|uniref:hypothetical protein n=1 Tax=Nocardia puris TaxID=208602 RepID=UPI002E23800D